MPYDFPLDIDRRVRAYIASGAFSDEDTLIREALDAYERQAEDMESIRRGFEDEAAGRVAPIESVAQAIPQK